MLILLLFMTMAWSFESAPTTIISCTSLVRVTGSYRASSSRKRGLGNYEEIKKNRKEGLESLVESKEKNAWLKDAGEEDVEKTKEDFVKWMKMGPPGARSEPAADPAADTGGDQIMSGL